ncbi:HhH-GPD family protein [Methylorubrum populi BJ001]|jgi:DNA-3-methyladenine glycosylase II|uniref:DNA-3-methyladenine glycosylase II n=1 Tax=Methylorubrum populi (strain ATCC BAA-705 / NCIMB 13946 / BJ001) TaxID=441620 RepID=B1ZG03_METPB|nr:(Fe-S)-cluster assembly protein [Methylorubrum populi]ACB78408.1 HhH-GPD family protein [Methylorubrum populi BJ001]OAH28089.1 Fe-S cluster assembly protein HesB [Methylorubrum populi]PZP67807.1 MAG: Fe-S cluster assembly protein HesB [Methylorubrum populi]
MLDAALYDRLLGVAAEVSEPLRTTIAAIGVIEIAPPPHASLAERLFVEVVNQQLSTKAALSIWTRIEAAAAAQVVTPRDLFVPGYEAVLRGCGVSANKVRALHAIREAEEAGLLGPDLAALPHAERSAMLCRIRGVGPWTADMAGIFHFLDPDIWPAGDVAAVGVLRRLTGIEDTVAVAARFAPYRSILARYMWRSRDAAPVAA